MVRSRGVLVWLAVSAACVAVARWALAPVPTDHATAGFDELLVGVSGAALAACAAWVWVVSTVVVGQVLRHSDVPLRRTRGVPTWVVRVVGAACGVALLGSGVAHAETGVRTPGSSVGPVLGPLGHIAGATAQTARADDSLDGLPFPDRAVGADHPSGPASSSGGRGGARQDDIVVRTGDSLWRLSAHRLGPDAGTAEIAAETAALYERNRDLVGPDPDLIHPGDRLRPPRT